MESVTLINSYGDALDSMTVTRKSIERNAEIPSETFAWKPLPGMWVDDIQAGQQYYVRSDGTKRPISFSENYAGLTYADLRGEEVHGARWIFNRRVQSALQSFAIKAVTWPGILVTLPAGYGVTLLARAALRRFRPRNQNERPGIMPCNEASIASLGRSDDSTGTAIPAECRSEGPT